MAGLEVEVTASGPQHISHEADQWMVLQPNSDPKKSPCELSPENCPQIRYGSEELETNGNYEPKKIARHAKTHKSKIGRCRRFYLLVIPLITVVLIAIVLSSSLTELLNYRQSVL